METKGCCVKYDLIPQNHAHPTPGSPAAVLLPLPCSHHHGVAVPTLQQGTVPPRGLRTMADHDGAMAAAVAPLHPLSACRVRDVAVPLSPVSEGAIWATLPGGCK